MMVIRRITVNDFRALMFRTVLVPPNSHRRNSSLFCALHERLGWCATIAPEIYWAKVAELVDALDLGSSAARRAGSIPVFRTKIFSNYSVCYSVCCPVVSRHIPLNPVKLFQNFPECFHETWVNFPNYPLHLLLVTT